MSATISYTSIGGDSYDSRSLTHEKRMLSIYRSKVAQDASLLQPLANACWRAACFEWALNRDHEAARRLWGEAAAALSRGFAERPSGFDPSPDQLVLAFNLSIAGRQRETFSALARLAAESRSQVLQHAKAFRGSRTHFLLAEGYAALARALVDRSQSLATFAFESLTAAREESNRDWWVRSFPNPLESKWLAFEHDAVCLLLGAIARLLSNQEPAAAAEETLVEQLSSVIDQVLVHLHQFLDYESDHYPKLYIWLPGVALCAMAESAGIPMDWIASRHQKQAPGFERLPLEFLRPTQH